MESLSYNYEGRRLTFTDDTEFQMDDHVRSRNLLKEWESFEGMGFLESGLPVMSRKSIVGTRCLENSVDDGNPDSGKPLPSSSRISLNSLLEFGTRFSGSAIKTNDEKLGKSCLTIEKIHSRELKGNQVSIGHSDLSSLEPSVSVKRARMTNLPSQIPVCTVYGCNKDLSNSKEYHKRHKVCEIHSKTAVVIVNGIQQRFCQQCSRFHVLAEFDEGKRSCRKRLAGHNARRRKPQMHTYFGSTLFGTDISSRSLLFSELIPGHPYSHEPTNQMRHLKLEEKPSRTSELTVPLNFKHSLPEMGKQYPSKNCLNSPLSVPGSSAGSNSSCALSLLSAQSPSLLTNSTCVSTDNPLFLHEKSSTSVFSSSSGANNLDLLQLSLHLQRVEQQKYSSQVKPEGEDGFFCHSHSTTT